MNLLEWFQDNTLLIFGALFMLFLIGARRVPSVKSIQDFADIFESKGGQLILLWITDLIVMTILVRYWKFFDAQLQTTIVGLLSGINGAFLGAIGARATSNGNGGGKPDALAVDFKPVDKK